MQSRPLVFDLAADPIATTTGGDGTLDSNSGWVYELDTDTTATDSSASFSFDLPFGAPSRFHVDFGNSAAITGDFVFVASIRIQATVSGGTAIVRALAFGHPKGGSALATLEDPGIGIQLDSGGLEGVYFDDTDSEATVALTGSLDSASGNVNKGGNLVQIFYDEHNGVAEWYVDGVLAGSVNDLNIDAETKNQQDYTAGVAVTDGGGGSTDRARANVAGFRVLQLQGSE